MITEDEKEKNYTMMTKHYATCTAGVQSPLTVKCRSQSVSKMVILTYQEAPIDPSTVWD